MISFQSLKYVFWFIFILQLFWSLAVIDNTILKPPDGITQQNTQINQEIPEFNFSEWVIKYELQEIEEILKRHGATTPESLSFDSSEFQSLIADTELINKSHILPKLMTAIHSDSVITIIVSEKEQNVIDSIQTNLGTLNEIELKLNNLIERYPESIQNVKNDKLNKIKQVKMKIDKIFDNLHNLLNKRKEKLFNEIDILEKEINKNNTNLSCVDVVQSSEKNIETIRKYLKKHKTRYQSLTSTNNEREQRKLGIIKIGENMKNEWQKSQNILNQNIYSLTEEISKNNNAIVNLDYVLKDGKHEQFIEFINEMGDIIHNYVDNKFEWDTKTSNSFLTIDGNKVINQDGSEWFSAFSSTAISKGIKEWKVKIIHSTHRNIMIGIIEDPSIENAAKDFSAVAGGYSYFGSSGIYKQKGNEYAVMHEEYGSSFDTNDVITVHLNLNIGQLSFFKNGKYQGKIPWEIKKTGQYYLAVSLPYEGDCVEVMTT